ncbi:MAG: hypothetical protein KF690_10200 [Bacteroidetes bacterium]|nr:hypothetical protein [Bacteroidota bacterium]
MADDPLVNSELQPEGLYAIGSNPNNYHPVFFCSCTTAAATDPTCCSCDPADRVCPPDNRLIINAFSSPAIVWQQPHNTLNTGSYYSFLASVENVLSGPADCGAFLIDPFLTVLVKPCSGSTWDTLSVSLPLPECPDVSQTLTCGFEATSGCMDVAIMNLAPGAAGNDFIIDNIGVFECLTQNVILSGCDLDAVMSASIRSFTGLARQGKVELNWIVESEAELLGYQLERAIEPGAWQKMAWVPATAKGVYVWQDLKPLAAAYYRLGYQDLAGNWTYHSLVHVRTTPGEPTLQLWPNPVSDKLYLSGSYLSAQIYDPQGKLVWEGPANQVLEVYSWLPGLYQVMAGTAHARFLIVH